MAPTSLDRRTKSKRLHRKSTKPSPSSNQYNPTLASTLLEHASIALSQADLSTALTQTQTALKHLTPPQTQTPCLSQLPALEILGAIHIELGDADAARQAFEQAAQVDPEGEYAGPEKFLWLAQLSLVGGEETVGWFDKGCVCLRRQLEREGSDEDEKEEVREKLANALCGAAEVYMTDLSFADDCEEKCEAYVKEAMKVNSESPAVLQTVASVRISQGRVEEAKEALEKSIAVWEDEDNTSEREQDLEEAGGDERSSKVPDFPTRISLVRLLMEVDMCTRAMFVLERLVHEDDESVEAWYLGGWCQYLLSQNQELGEDTSGTKKIPSLAARRLAGSRKWLQRSLKEFEKQEYEDDRLRSHAEELVREVDKRIGPAPAGADPLNEDEDDEWEGVGDDEDIEDGEDAVMNEM